MPTKNNERFENENSLYENKYRGNIGFLLFFSIKINNIKLIKEITKRRLTLSGLKLELFTCIRAYTSKNNAHDEVTIPAQSILELAV